MDTAVTKKTTADALEHWKSRSTGWKITNFDAQPRDDIFNIKLASALCIHPGSNILDVASGTGEPSIWISKLLEEHKGATITATDMTYEMLNIARERAQLLNFTNIRFAIASMDRLPFADNSFDGLTCRMGLMFPKDKENCVKEAHRVLKAGGAATYLCWGPLRSNPAFQLFSEAMKNYFHEKFPIREVRHCLGEVGAITKLLHQAGFSAVNEEVISYKREVTRGDAYFRQGIARTWPDRVAEFTDNDWAPLLKHTEEVFSVLKKGSKFFIPINANICRGRVK
ncbi:MAG: hypothetical protein CMM44_08815 [Rhodospirillaceae bacterium]|nr:hypothetical protein [Rhodospirillaceae bacterium]|tara:strand:- start:1064 stop:1912 length:849 start_codon:yes stop_codon:yes gene_type:complete